MEIPEIKGYCVYYHRNIEDGKLYIGLSNNLKKRWNANGSQYRCCTHFYRAIQKYGWDNFEHIVLMDGLTKQMAGIIEQELIAKYNTRECGYNIAQGGFGGCTVKGKDHWYSKPVYQYDLDGNYIREWENAQRASEELHIIVSDIHANCRKTNGVRKAGNYMWSYTKLPYMEKYVRLASAYSSREPLLQLDKNFNVVQRYKCISYVDDTLYSREHITNCCKRKSLTHQNYYWVYEKDFDESFINYVNERIKKSHIKSNTKHIFQCDLNKNIIQEFRTAAEVEELTGFNRNSVQLYCKRPEHNHGISTGYYWIYTEDYYKEIDKTNQN